MAIRGTNHTNEEMEMDIDSMTIGEAKKLAQMFGGAKSVPKELIGDYVIVRCRDAGVHAGTLVDYEGRNVVLKNSRRLWYWVCAEKQHSLSGVACVGLDAKKSKIPAPVHTLVLSDACEIISTTEAAQKSIVGAAIYEAG